MVAAARVPDRRDMVDVDAEAEVGLRVTPPCGSPASRRGWRPARPAARPPRKSARRGGSAGRRARRDRRSPPERSTRAAAAITSPPASSIASIASRDERPVVTTSSTSSTFWPGSSRKPRRSSNVPVGPLDEHRLDAQRAAHFVADDHPAHRRRDDDLDLRAQSRAGCVAASAEARRDGARRVHQHPRALQVARAVQPRGEDEMALEQRAGGAEFGQDFLFGHRHSLALKWRPH